MTQQDGLQVRIAHRNVIFKFLSTYRWARISDIALMLWPDNSNASARAHLLCRSLESQKILHRRSIPDGMGFVVLLTKQGADLASEVLGVNVFCWEKMGVLSSTNSSQPALWYPCKRVKHAVLTRTAIAFLYGRGKAEEFRSEEDWKSEFKNSDGKIPDSTFNFRSATYWVEVENAHKTGKNMQEVAQAAVDVLLERKKICTDFCLVATKGSRHIEVFKKHFKEVWKRDYSEEILYLELDFGSDPRLKLIQVSLKKIEFDAVQVSDRELYWDDLVFIRDRVYSNKWTLKGEGVHSTLVLRLIRDDWIANLNPPIDGFNCEEYLNGISVTQVELAMSEAKKWAFQILSAEKKKFEESRRNKNRA